jgi:hypothetical protein
MIKLMMLITIIAVSLCAYSVHLAVNASIDSNTYQMYYEAARSETQALYRTIGRHKDSAYVCKLRK